MTKGKKILTGIFLAVLLACIAVALTMTPKQARASSVTADDFSFEAGAGIRVSETEPLSTLRFTLVVNTEVFTESDVITIEVAETDAAVQLLDGPNLTISNAVNSRLYIRVAISEPAGNVRLRATCNGISCESDTRSPLYVFRAAYEAGELEGMYSETQIAAILGFIDAVDTGFVEQVKSQKFVRIHQNTDFYTTFLPGTFSSLLDSTSHGFDYDLIYKFSESSPHWYSAFGTGFKLTFGEDKYYATFTLGANKSLDVTHSSEVEVDYQYYYDGNSFYFKFNLFYKTGGMPADINLHLGSGVGVSIAMSCDNDAYTQELIDVKNQYYSEMLAAKAEMGEYKTENETLKTQVAELTSSIEARNATIDSLTAERDSLLTQIDSLNAEISSLNVQISDLKEENSALFSDLDETKLLLDQTEKALNANQIELVVEIRELTKEVSEYKALVEAIEEENAKLREEAEAFSACASSFSGGDFAILLVVAMVMLTWRIYDKRKKKAI